jgi:transposase-like protein
MNTYKRHRFPPYIVSFAVGLYFRFNLSHRDIEDVLAELGVKVSSEAIRFWCKKFDALYARRLKRKQQGYEMHSLLMKSSISRWSAIGTCRYPPERLLSVPSSSF